MVSASVFGITTVISVLWTEYTSNTTQVVQGNSRLHGSIVYKYISHVNSSLNAQITRLLGTGMLKHFFSNFLPTSENNINLHVFGRFRNEYRSDHYRCFAMTDYSLISFRSMLCKIYLLICQDLRELQGFLKLFRNFHFPFLPSS